MFLMSFLGNVNPQKCNTAQISTVVAHWTHPQPSINLILVKTKLTVSCGSIALVFLYKKLLQQKMNVYQRSVMKHNFRTLY
jgi:hypothetical protein